MTTPCIHCGLPVPEGMVDPESEHQFCCSGCRLAYEIIHQHGLDRYYDLRASIDTTPMPSAGRSKTYREFDDPAFAELYCRTLNNGLSTIELYLEGVHCAACVWLVERTTHIIDGVAEIRLDLGRSLATVIWDSEQVQLSAIAGFINSLGYAPHPYHGVEALAMARKEERALLLRIAISGAIAGNVMLLAFSLYGGYFHGIADTYEQLFRWASMLLSLPSVVWAANTFYRGAWGALLARRLHMDVPISIGILAGTAWGSLNTVRGGGEIYFDSVTVLIFFLLIGRFVQRRQQQKAARSTELLFSLAPSTARLVDDNGYREVPVVALVGGNLIEIRAGESIPADGVVRRGESELDRSLLTGETRPEAVGPGIGVHAGTVNRGGVLQVEVVATGESTRLGQLLQMVEEGAKRRAPVIALADRISGVFVSAVLVLALTTLVLWLRIDPQQAIENAIALLIVSCPCALGLATPLAVGAAIGQAARRGILVKGGDALEALARPGHMLLDKTGTLTEGRIVVVDCAGDRELLPIIARLEQVSSHPIARAFESFALNEPEDANDRIEGLHEERGKGIMATIGDQRWILGSVSWVRESVDELPAPFESFIGEALGRGLSPMLCAIDAEVKLVVALGDPLRSDAKNTLGDIRGRGWTVEILSGDHPSIVAAIASELGIEAGNAHGGQTPEDKIEVVTQRLLDGPVVMVGDGVNDAAALARATVGIGVHGGAEATLAAADVYLSRPGLAPLHELVEGSRRTLGVIRRNLTFSLIYNVVAVTLAMLGMMHPLVAAILMPLSSITVVYSSYRARTFSEA